MIKNINKIPINTKCHVFDRTLFLQIKYQVAAAIATIKKTRIMDGGRDAVTIPTGLRYRVAAVRKMIPAMKTAG